MCWAGLTTDGSKEGKGHRNKRISPVVSICVRMVEFYLNSLASKLISPVCTDYLNSDWDPSTALSACKHIKWITLNPDSPNTWRWIT